MSWSYRLVRSETGGSVSMREVYWKESARDVPIHKLTYEHVDGWTESAVSIWAGSTEGILETLKLMEEAARLEVLEESTMFMEYWGYG